jgi:hypothetical protein
MLVGVYIIGYFILFLQSAKGYRSLSSRSPLTKLFLFNFGKPSKSNSNNTPNNPAVVAKKLDDEKLEQLKKGLAKVSRTQNRDYEAEAKAKIVAPIISDKQPSSYNYLKPDEFPHLYKGWLRKEGDQIARQMISASKAALKNGNSLIEILFDPVPNLDEVAFGTTWNQRHRQDILQELQVPEYATNRGGANSLEWANLYWAARLIRGISSNNNNNNEKFLVLSISGTGIRGQETPTLPSNVQFMRLSDWKNILKPIATAPTPPPPIRYTGAIILSPCQEIHYREGAQISQQLKIPVIAFNAPYSYRYDIGNFKFQNTFLSILF